MDLGISPNFVIGKQEAKNILDNTKKELVDKLLVLNFGVLVSIVNGHTTPDKITVNNLKSLKVVNWLECLEVVSPQYLPQ